MRVEFRSVRLRLLRWRALGLLALLVFLPSPSRAPGAAALSDTAAQDTKITVSAAISMKDVLGDTAQLYRRKAPEVQIDFNFGASGTLQRQIEQGAPVDIFISAAAAEMNALERKNLIIRDTRKDLVTNSVVLITPQGCAGVNNFQDLVRSSVKFIAIGNPQSVPAGKYAQEVLTHFGLYQTLQAKLVFANDVRQVLSYVATGNADAGIVYATDARTSREVVVAAAAPEDSHEPVVYPVAIIAASHDPQAARGFEDFLFSSESAEPFEKYGFKATGK
jgi:molybdate transport system substrate-binding protein